MPAEGNLSKFKRNSERNGDLLAQGGLVGGQTMISIKIIWVWPWPGLSSPLDPPALASPRMSRISNLAT